MISTWKTILSPKSMRTLSTPLALFCRSYLVVAIGSDTAEEVMRYSYSFMAKMDEGETRTELENDLAYFFYPTLGILRGLISVGYSEDTAEEIVSDMWDFAPDGLKKRPWASYHS